MDSLDEPLCTDKREPNLDCDISPNLNYTHRADYVQPSIRKEMTVAVVGKMKAVMLTYLAVDRMCSF